MKITGFMKFKIKQAIEYSMDECDSCGSFHPVDYIGDCRNDDYRYTPNDLFNKLINVFEEGD